MHDLFKHIKISIKIILLSLIGIFVTTASNSEQSAEEIIKNRKALFSKNYNTAKKVQSLSSNGDFDDAKILMLEMSENYKNLKEMFPDNSKEGFKTESLPIIWEEKDAFDALMLMFLYALMLRCFKNNSQFSFFSRNKRMLLML